MLQIAPQMRILVALEAVDLRKGIDGLAVLCREKLAADPATIQDHATFAQPHQYASGVRHVLVNGTAVLRDGEHTGATPGRVVRGPGYRG